MRTQFGANATGLARYGSRPAGCRTGNEPAGRSKQPSGNAYGQRIEHCNGNAFAQCFFPYFGHQFGVAECRRYLFLVRQINAGFRERFEYLATGFERQRAACDRDDGTGRAGGRRCGSCPQDRKELPDAFARDGAGDFQRRLHEA